MGIFFVSTCSLTQGSHSSWEEPRKEKDVRGRDQERNKGIMTKDEGKTLDGAICRPISGQLRLKINFFLDLS